MYRSSALSTFRIWLLVLSVVLVMLTPAADAQRRTSSGIATNFDDVVFAMSFSPDGRTLAIARGASDPVQRYGRIELWDTETGKLRHLIKGFDGPVRSISFSPDGQTLISGSTEFRSPKIQQKARSREGVSLSELKWWDTRTGELKQKRIMPGEGSYSIKATQSPDGKQLVLAESFWDFIFVNPLFEPAGSVNMGMANPRVPFRSRSFMKVEIKLIDAQTGELRSKLDASQSGATSFSPDGNLLAMANGNEVKLWDSQTGKEMRKLKDLKGTANAIAFSPNSLSLAVASTKYEREDAEQFIKVIAISEVKVFDVASGKVILRLKDVGAVNALGFSPDGRILVAGGVLPSKTREVAGLKLFDFQTGKVKDLPTGSNYKEAVNSLVISSDGGLLAFTAGSATVKLLDTQKGVITQTWDADSVGDAVERSTSRFLLSVKRMMAVAFSRDGTTVSGESDHGEIKSWDHRTGEIKRQLNTDQDEPSLVAVSLDGKAFAEVTEGELLYWNGDSETKRTVPLAEREPATAVALSADGQMLALANRGGISLQSPIGEVVRKLAVQEGVAGRLAFSNDGRSLAGADQFGNVRIWNVVSGLIEKTLTTNAEITAMVFSPNGQTMATAAPDNYVSIWNLQSGLPQGKFQKHDATINALAFSPNGQMLASGSDDRTIVLWEVAAGKSKRTFKGHDQTVTSLAFSPDGRLLASGSGNASVVVWEVETGKLSRVLR